MASTGTAILRLREHGFELPTVPTARAGSYAPFRQVGEAIHVAGQLPLVDGELPARGLLGADVDIAVGQRLACVAAVNCLAVGAAAVGSLDRLRIVQMLVFVASTPDFGDHATVADGATRLLLDVLGEDGAHARTAIGVAGLPRSSPVEIQMICTWNATS